MTSENYGRPSKYERGMSSLSKLRVEAATKNNALEYATYCIATGITPEDQYSDLFVQGLEERKQSPAIAEKLEFIIEKILTGKDSSTGKTKNPSKKTTAYSSKDDYNKKFLKEALTYSSNISQDIDGKIKLLQKFYAKFREGGSDDLTKYLHMEMSDTVKAERGRQFNHFVESYYTKYYGDKVYRK